MKKLFAGLLLLLLVAPLQGEVIRAIPPAGGSGGGTSLPVDDGTAVVKGSADPTKMLRFEVDGFTAGTTRVMTFPNSDATFPCLGCNNTYSGGNNTFSSTSAIGIGGSGASGGGISNASAQTPDMPTLTVGTTSGAWLIAQNADLGTDFAHALTTHPTFFFHTSNTTPITEYQAIRAVGQQTELFKTLTESAATSLVRIPVAAGAGVGGTIHYTVFASDGTDHQSRSSLIRFSVVNKAATETCGLTNNAGTADASITEVEDGNASAISTSTLTYAITCDVTPANAVDIQVNAVSGLTQTTLRAYYTVNVQGPGEPLPQ